MKILIRSMLTVAFLLVANIGLAQDLSSFIKELPNQEAFWSVTVYNADGEPLESINSDKLIVPASNQKLYTTAAILDRLGSDFRYVTRVFGDGEVVDSVWQGSLTFVGSGDPSISGFLYEGDAYHVFEEIYKQLNEQGIYEVDGALRADVAYFDQDSYPKGWSWDDLSFYYGVEISPLSFNNNAVDLIVFADGEVGEKPSITWFPENTSYVSFVNSQIIAPADTEYDEYYRRELGNNRIILGSSLPRGYVEKESLSIHGAPHFFLSSFNHYMALFRGPDRSSTYSTLYPSPGVEGMKLLASHSSKPLSELVAWANKESDNFYVEMMLKTLAAEEVAVPGTFEDGIQEVRDFLAETGVDTSMVMMKDGSGMAAGNYTTTQNIATLLVKMQQHPEFEAFYNSLAIAGIDGSIAHRFKGTPLYNNFRGKTGYVGGQRALSGYLTARSGEEIIVSIATSNFQGKVRPVDASHQQILEYLYEKY